MTERRTGPQHAVILPALCERSDGTEFHAVTVDMSAVGLKLRAATLPRTEEALVCHVRGVGAIAARVVWASACDFAVKVTGRDPAPGEVARRLIELSRRQARQPDDVRVSRRIVPLSPDVRVTLADGAPVPARIVNFSATGVALRLDAALTIGQAIVVGCRPATVARRIEGGVGAAFLVPLDDAAVGEHTVL